MRLVILAHRPRSLVYCGISETKRRSMLTAHYAHLASDGEYHYPIHCEDRNVTRPWHGVPVSLQRSKNLSAASLRRITWWSIRSQGSSQCALPITSPVLPFC